MSKQIITHGQSIASGPMSPAEGDKAAAAATAWASACHVHASMPAHGQLL